MARIKQDKLAYTIEKMNFRDKSFFNTEALDSDQSLPIFTEVHGDPDPDCKNLDDENVAILPLRNMILFPGVALPVSVGRSRTMKLIKEAYENKSLVGVVCQIDPNVNEPVQKDLYTTGTIAEVIKILEMPDHSTTVILQGKKKFHLDEIHTEYPYLRGRVTLQEENNPKEDDEEFKGLIDRIRDISQEIVKIVNESHQEALFAIKNIQNPSYLVNFLCSNLGVAPEEKQSLLELESTKERAYQLIKFMSHDLKLFEIKENIQQKTKVEISQQQRDMFLQAHLKTIQNELGMNVIEDELEELNQKAEEKQWNEEVEAIFDKEMRKLERMNPSAPDYSIQMNYIQTMLNLPWGVTSKDNLNLKHAQKVLDKDHFGLDTVKERILEHLAVLKLRGDLKSPIICLYGPPGVGKTSLGRSIADAINRKYVRISLGGLHDEAEIRGHRRTYIGAMPGRIINGLIKAGTSNPVFVLDEIDKIGSDHKGDPSSALLEVLDPEQNVKFHDNYLDIDYDLSNILFIATANSLSSIQQPLRDRMEIIDVSGYITEEKVEIGRRHLLPKQLEAHGIEKGQFDIPKKTMEYIVEQYTREAGVRALDKAIAKIMRKVAHKIAIDAPYPLTMKKEHLAEYLGTKNYTRDHYEGNDYAGVVTGLAWTSVGGEILFVESSLTKSKNDAIGLTGNLGTVMKESAILAMQYIKSHAYLYDISDETLEKWNVHIHLPEGAIPKDGPSAGITMATSIISSLTQRKVKAHIAMTGEITLRGRVLPVGGIKEKILAAKRAGIKEIILSKANEKDINEINERYVKGLTFHYVNDVKEVIDIALLKEKVKNPIEL